MNSKATYYQVFVERTPWQLTTLLLLSVVLALLKPMGETIRLGARLVLGTALVGLLLLESPSMLAAGYLAIPGFLAGLASGGNLLDRLARAACASAGLLTLSLILHHPLAGLGLGASAAELLLGQVACAFCAGTLLQAGLLADIADWNNRLPAIFKTAALSWSLAAAIRAISG